jgi:hypothetical protein
MTLANKYRPIIIQVSLILVFMLLFIVLTHSGVLAADLDVPEVENELYKDSIEQNPIIEWINFFINVFTVIVLAGSVLVIAAAGIQYTAARDNAQGVQAAKQKITNVILGLLAYFFFFGFIQWLIPGGVF